MLPFKVWVGSPSENLPSLVVPHSVPCMLTFMTLSKETCSGCGGHLNARRLSLLTKKKETAPGGFHPFIHGHQRSDRVSKPILKTSERNDSVTRIRVSFSSRKGFPPVTMCSLVLVLDYITRWNCQSLRQLSSKV